MIAVPTTGSFGVGTTTQKKVHDHLVIATHLVYVRHKALDRSIAQILHAGKIRELYLLAVSGLKTRKPRLLLRLSGELLLRFAERQLLALLFQLPPRLTRFEPLRPLPTAILHFDGVFVQKFPTQAVAARVHSLIYAGNFLRFAV
jgi:hypothetical protein